MILQHLENCSISVFVAVGLLRMHELTLVTCIALGENEIIMLYDPWYAKPYGGILLPVLILNLWNHYMASSIQYTGRKGSVDEHTVLHV